jgi:hypothetical protein
LLSGVGGGGVLATCKRMIVDGSSASLVVIHRPHADRGRQTNVQ